MFSNTPLSGVKVEKNKIGFERALATPVFTCACSKWASLLPLLAAFTCLQTSLRVSTRAWPHTRMRGDRLDTDRSCKEDNVTKGVLESLLSLMI